MCQEVLNHSPSCDQIIPVLFSLHWLSIGVRIEHKILLLTYKALLTLPEFYLTNLVDPRVPSRTLRPAALESSNGQTVLLGSSQVCECLAQTNTRVTAL